MKCPKCGETLTTLHGMTRHYTVTHQQTFYDYLLEHPNLVTTDALRRYMSLRKTRLERKKLTDDVPYAHIHREDGDYASQNLKNLVKFYEAELRFVFLNSKLPSSVGTKQRVTMRRQGLIELERGKKREYVYLVTSKALQLLSF